MRCNGWEKESFRDEASIGREGEKKKVMLESGRAGMIELLVRFCDRILEIEI